MPRLELKISEWKAYLWESEFEMATAKFSHLNVNRFYNNTGNNTV